MLRAALAFFVLAVIAGSLEISGIYILTAMISTALFSIFAILFLVFLTLGLIAAKRKESGDAPSKLGKI